MVPITYDQLCMAIHPALFDLIMITDDVYIVYMANATSLHKITGKNMDTSLGVNDNTDH